MIDNAALEALTELVKKATCEHMRVIAMENDMPVALAPTCAKWTNQIDSNGNVHFLTHLNTDAKCTCGASEKNVDILALKDVILAGLKNEES